MPTIRTPARPAQESARARTLTLTQVVASALAAVTATILASYLGVTGTVVGAAVASAATVTANAVYSRSIRRADARLRTVLPTPASARPPAAHHARRWALTGPQRFVFAAAGLFLMIALVVTGIEVATGRSLTNLLHNKSGGGTSFWPGGSRGSQSPTPAPTHTPSRLPATQQPARLANTPQQPAQYRGHPRAHLGVGYRFYTHLDAAHLDAAHLAVDHGHVAVGPAVVVDLAEQRGHRLSTRGGRVWAIGPCRCGAPRDKIRYVSDRGSVEMTVMKAVVGDQLVVLSQHLDQPGRVSEIVEVHSATQGTRHRGFRRLSDGPHVGPWLPMQEKLGLCRGSEPVAALPRRGRGARCAQVRS
jgi:hypothetical protein